MVVTLAMVVMLGGSSNVGNDSYKLTLMVVVQGVVVYVIDNMPTVHVPVTPTETKKEVKFAVRPRVSTHVRAPRRSSLS